MGLQNIEPRAVSSPRHQCLSLSLSHLRNTEPRALSAVSCCTQKDYQLAISDTSHSHSQSPEHRTYGLSAASCHTNSISMTSAASVSMTQNATYITAFRLLSCTEHLHSIIVTCHCCYSRISYRLCCSVAPALRLLISCHKGNHPLTHSR